jgi:amino acid adenylation domain-containing protein
MTVPDTSQVSNEAQNGANGSTIRLFPPLPQSLYKTDPSRREELSIDILDGLKPHCMEFGSPYLLPVAWATILARYTDSDQVLFGLAYRGRKTDMGSQAIYPFRQRISSDATVTDALAAAARYDDQMGKYEHMGLAKFSALNPGNIVLSKFHSLLVIGDNIHDVRTEIVEEQYPLTLYARGTTIQACFDPLVLSSHLLRTMLIQVADFVQASMDKPDSTILDVQRVGKKGLAQMQSWHDSRNRVLPAEDNDVRVQELINVQLLTRPSALAVNAWDGCLTYAELNRWSSCTSRRIVLDKIGVQPGQFIGLLMSKSVMTVVAMLSVIKSGAGFIFLSPSLPVERLRSMCRIAGVQLILTTTVHQTKAAEIGIPVTQMDAEPTSTEEIEPFDSNVQSGPLYAVFTSGSTGEPKGVQVDRESFGPGVAEFLAQTRLGPDSRIFQSVSYAFVVSILEQLMALAAGACICIPSEVQLENDMDATMTRCKANWAVMTPTVARTLMPNQLSELKTLVLAGEPVTVADVMQWESLTALYSLYGQSETASTLLLRQIHRSVYDAGNLGAPTTGKCWVVDPNDHHQLCAAGIEGELLLESTALGLRYLSNHEQTALTFVERPFWSCELEHSDQRHRRWLLTGDLVKYNTLDGSIQIVGRKGTQTKIRGQRVELTEIESCLRASYPPGQPIVAEVVTPAPSSESGQAAPILIAFTCTDPQVPLPALGLERQPTAESRAHSRKALAALRQMLPAYMVPSDILDLRYLPRTTSGKINRKALRDWAAERAVDEILGIDEERVAFRPANTPEEHVLQSVCQKILHLPSSKVSLDDNFFQIGGDSLTARQLVSASRLRGFHITVSDVFDQPTLAALATRYIELELESKFSNADDDPFGSFKAGLLQVLPPELDARNVEDAFPTLEMQSHLVEYGVFDYFPMEISGDVNADQLRRTCQVLVDVQPALRSIFIPFKGQTTQVVLCQADISWKEQTAPSGMDLMEWARSWVMQDREIALPTTKPTVSFTLIHHESKKSAFVIRLSHAQYDGVCLKPMFRQLQTIYSDLETASQRRPEADFISYRRVCALLRTPQAFKYWRGLLAGSEMTRFPRLGTGEVTPAIYSGECIPAHPPAGITMATAIKAAWAYVLARETGKSDVLFGQVTNCRGIQPEAGQDIIGMCLNTTPVRVQVEPTTRVRDLLAMVQQQHVKSLEHETIDWFDMVAQSTSWPADTDLDTAVLHENFANVNEISFGNAIAQIHEPIFKPVGSMRHLLITWPGPESMMTFFITRTGALDKTFADGLVIKFNEALVRFLASPDEVISPVG